MNYHLDAYNYFVFAHALRRGGDPGAPAALAAMLARPLAPLLRARISALLAERPRRGRLRRC